jgi:hypothetical protein
MRVFKNLQRDGKQTTTQTIVKAALMADAVAKETLEKK